MGDKPLHERDTITVPRTHQNLISMRYIGRTGKVPMGITSESYNIDWGRKDAFTDAVRTIEERSQKRIEAEPVLQMLLKQKTWTKDDREIWEETVAKFVKEETAKIPGFASYRTIHSADRPNTKPLHRLNDLSSDITGNTENLRFDCGVESLVKGTVIQRIEDKNLPAGDRRDVKTAAPYFFATGMARFSADDSLGGHAFLLAPSGNIIEATVNDDTNNEYRRAAFPNTLETFVRGNGIVADGDSTYGVSNGLKPFFFTWVADQQKPQIGLAKVEDATAGVLANRREEGVVFSREQLYDRTTMKGFRVAEDKKGDFIMCVSAVNKDGRDDYELKLYQKVNVGSPQEGYTLVGYKHDDKKPGSSRAGLSITYTDPLTSRTYHADADVSKMTTANLKLYQIRQQPGARGMATAVYDYQLRDKGQLSNPSGPSLQSLAPVAPAFNATAAAEVKPKPLQSKFGTTAPETTEQPADPTPATTKRAAAPAVVK